MALRDSLTGGVIQATELNEMQIISTINKKIRGGPSSETQGMLVGTMQYFQVKAYFKSWRSKLRPQNIASPKILHCPN